MSKYVLSPKNVLLEDNKTLSLSTDSGSRKVARVERIKRRLAIGIPTVKRKDTEYLMDTLSSMLSKLNNKQLENTVLVIFLADLNDTEYIENTEMKIRKNFLENVESGSVEIITAPDSFYTTLPTFRTNMYTNWRTKQNYDYAYLMQYCSHIAELYLQMEDDVIAADGYYDAIMEYVSEHDKKGWICLEFSELGFIGKLYHSSDLRNLASMLLMFSTTQSVNETYLYYNKLKGFGDRNIRKPTLFQHRGVHSSLTGKIQLLQDTYFDPSVKQWRGDNPPARIFTTLKENNDYPTNAPYLPSSGHFWANAAGRENDTYLLMFERPQILTEVIAETGSKDTPNDIIRDGVVEASSTFSGSEQIPSCKNFQILGQFVNGRAVIDKPVLQSKLGETKTKCLQIRLTKSQNEWVILREIAVFIQR